MSNTVMLALALVATLLYLLAPMLFPFLMAALLAYLGNPLVIFLEKYKCSRTVAVIVVFAVISIVLMALVLTVLPMIEQQISLLVHKVPDMLVWLKEIALPWAKTNVSALKNVDAEKLQQTLQDNMGSASSLLMSLLGSMTSSGMAFLSGLATVVLTPVLTFYFLRDWQGLVAKMQGLFPRRSEKAVATLANEVDAVLAAFFKGQILVMLSLAVIYSIGLSIAGLEFALLIGLIAGVVSFVPYLGLVIGLLLGCFAAFFQVPDLSLMIPVLLVFGLGQILESVVLTPYLVGDRIGLHPVAVIFAVMAGGQLFGFIGVLIALPVAAVLLVFLRHLHDEYKSSETYTGA